MSALVLALAPALTSQSAAAATHPIGMWRLAALIVVVFLAALGLTAGVGTARARRRGR